MRLGTILLLLAPGALGLAARAAAEPASAVAVRFAAPRAGQTLRGGETVLISWDGLGSDAQELELLLSVDGGRHFSLRLTEELEPDSSSYLWRVPNLVCNRASLAIRAGLGGREEIVGSGPVFSIEPDASAPQVFLEWKTGEIWASESDDDDDDAAQPPVPAAGLDAQPARVSSLPNDSIPANVSTVLGLKIDRSGRRLGAAVFSVCDQAFRRESPRPLLSFPQRI